MVQRRGLLTGMVAIGTATLAGCSGSSDDSSASGDGGESEEDEETETTHQIGDTFTVGEGDRAIEYTVNGATTYEAIGGEFSQEEPDGIFLVVQLELTNQADESFSISSSAFSVRDSEGRTFDPDTGAGVYLSTDDRIEGEAISFDQLNPGLSKSGVLVFDVPPGESVGLLIEPSGIFDSSESHFVELGGI